MSLKYHKVFPVEQKGACVVVVPSGDAAGFRESDVEQELKAVTDLVANSPGTNLVIDLGQSAYFGSIIIGAVVALGRTAIDHGGRVAWCGASEEMRKMLAIMQLDSLWPAYDNRKQAVRALK